MSIKDLSHLGTLSFDEGSLGSNLPKKRREYSIGDHLEFYPCVGIDKYSVSDTYERFLKHIFYDIYEFTFTAIDMYQLCYEEGDVKNVYHYLVEIMPGFNVFHFNWTKKVDEYLKVGTLYRGFGRLSNCGNPAIDNPKIHHEAIEKIKYKGILENIQANRIWRDCYEYITPSTEKANDDPCGVISYIDVLRSIGYPDDMLKFRANISKYQDDQVSRDSTGQNTASDTLIFRIKMV